MKKYLFIAMALLCHTAKAQNVAQEAVYFTDGTTMTANRVNLRLGAFDRYFLLADGKQIQAEKVKFFENYKGFFANVTEFDYLRSTRFAERVEYGRINLYRNRQQYYLLDDERYVGHWEGAREQSGTLYYNKGMERVKKMTYVNLMFDLNDNQQSMDLLAGYRKKRKASYTYFGLAGASLVASFFTFFREERTSSGFLTSRSDALSYAFMGAGATFGLFGGLKYIQSERKFIEAIEVYNR